MWRLSRGRSRDRLDRSRGRSADELQPAGRGVMSRKPGSVDSLLDWDSDSTRPPSIPPRTGGKKFISLSLLFQ